MSETKQLNKLELSVPKNTHKVILELDNPEFALLGISYEITMSKWQRFKQLLGLRSSK